MLRTCLITFFAIVLSLNAAYAAGAGICDAMEQAQDCASHIGHHLHEHEDDQDTQSLDTNAASKMHLHDHAHPSFSFLLASVTDGVTKSGNSPLTLSPTESFSSASLSPPYHPPRAALA